MVAPMAGEVAIVMVAFLHSAIHRLHSRVRFLPVMMAQKNYGVIVALSARLHLFVRLEKLTTRPGGKGSIYKIPVFPGKNCKTFDPKLINSRLRKLQPGHTFTSAQVDR
jgi:hypothetical protein